MTAKKATVLFLGNGRCFHTMDWFRSAQKIALDEAPVLITDLIQGESFEKLIASGDQVRSILVLDRFLFSGQSHVGNMWRNVVKLITLPLQIIQLRKVLRAHPVAIIHAHAMYYIVLARFSGRKYVATPQGSELLVRPYRSRLYRLFASFGLSGASQIVVDSVAMRKSLLELFNLNGHIIQNGIDVDGIAALHQSMGMQGPVAGPEHVVSLRAFAPNYQIDSLVNARDEAAPDVSIHLCYPFEEREYKATVLPQLKKCDRDLGRLSRLDLHQLLLRSRLAVSIPISDSSPRTVYEAIFCGCFVAATKGDWINYLPPCMAARVIVVDLASKTWLRDAIDLASANSHLKYTPSLEALEVYDQKASSRKYYRDIYPLVVNESPQTPHGSSAARDLEA